MIFRNWFDILTTCNLPSERKMDPVSKWLIIIRACVFPMDIISALIGGLLAASVKQFTWGPFLLAAVGLLFAHAANNMINDYVDLLEGVDTEGYIRAQYAPHPVLSGMVSKATLLRAILFVNLVDLAIALYLTWLRGWLVMAFAVAGLFFSVFYVAPPLRLKQRGLGELTVFLVWAPLMIGGTYFVTAGNLPWWVLLASVPYGLLVTTVLFGKHIDKYDADKAKGIHTLPVLMGQLAARRFNVGLMIAFYGVVVALVIYGYFTGLRGLGPWLLLVVFSIPQLLKTMKVYAQPKPAEPPFEIPNWPLWFVSWAFLFNERAGGLFVLGLILNWMIPAW